MKGQRYKVRYSAVHVPEGITKEELQKLGDWGGTDVLGIVSMLFPDDGSLSVNFVGLDGRTGKPIEPADWFRAFGLLAYQLSGDLKPGTWQQRIAAATHETIKDMVSSIKNK